MKNKLNFLFNFFKYILNFIMKILVNFKKENIIPPNLNDKFLLEKKKKEIKERLPFELKYPESYKLQKKLALLVADINKIDEKDIKYCDYKKYNYSMKNTDLIGYRIDFHNKDELEFFREKYFDDLL